MSSDAFDKAIAEIETYFTLLTDKPEQAPDRTVEVTSGGVRTKPDDALPALLATRDLAIDYWSDAMLLALGDEDVSIAGFMFTDGPHLDKHLMTNQTSRQQQRTVEDRFCVVATVAIYNTLPDQKDTEIA